MVSGYLWSEVTHAELRLDKLKHAWRARATFIERTDAVSENTLYIIKSTILLVVKLFFVPPAV